MWKHFNLDMFACPCCRNNLISEKLILKLDSLCDALHTPSFKIKSGYRCIYQNNVIGNQAGAYHVDGLAADIDWSEWPNALRYKLVSKAMCMGFRGIGIDGDTAHLDIRRGTQIFWVYK